jgi:hypothetical protein
MHGTRRTGLRSSRLDIMDLAGASPQSEGVHSAAQAEGSDLYALRRVVNQLAARTPKRRVDYGASPLTHLLRDALGGNSVTTVVATVTDSEAHMGATAHTLEFAHMVRGRCELRVLLLRTTGLLAGVGLLSRATRVRTVRSPVHSVVTSPSQF